MVLGLMFEHTICSKMHVQMFGNNASGLGGLGEQKIYLKTQQLKGNS
jgi:hypothetical protein